MMGMFKKNGQPNMWTKENGKWVDKRVRQKYYPKSDFSAVPIFEPKY